MNWEGSIRVVKAIAGTALLAVAGFLAGACAGLGSTQGAAGPLPGGSPVDADAKARMFWTVSSSQGGTAYVQGTMHLGSDELYPFAPAVLESLKKADLVLAELSSADMDRGNGLVLNRMAEAILEGGKILGDYLGEDEIAFLENYMGKEAYRRLAPFRPWVAYSTLDVYAAGKAGLDPTRGVDIALYAAAAEYGKSVAGLESAESQLDILTGPPLSTQILILKDAIREYREYPSAIADLYKSYLRDDRRRLARQLDDSLARTKAWSTPVADFNDSLLAKRNALWAGRLSALLEQGRTVFVFAGVAHFLGAGNVLELLEKQGYKVRANP
ncbi:MAG: TraB/GumN family protein [Spirochaetales bacterium]|nr:MAG: TraB/GumN family protein [Spirochaetales bacterium]